MPYRLSEIEKLRREDHDTLIRLESKVTDLITEVREMKDGIKDQLTDHEVRLKAIEKLRDSIDTASDVNKIHDLWEWKHDFSLTWKLIVGLASILGAVVYALISLVSPWLIKLLIHL